MFGGRWTGFAAVCGGALALALVCSENRAALAQAAPPAATPPGQAATPPAAPAPAGAAPDYEAAREHYQAAEKARAAGQFATAAREYGVAYDITKDPILFFKMGESYDKAGDCRAALIYYGRYLREAHPEDSYRDKTEHAIAGCRARQAGGAGQAGSAGATAAGLAGEAGAGGAAGVGAGAGSSGAADTESPPMAPLGPEAPSFVDEGTSWQRTAAWISVGCTIGLATTGAILGLSARSRQEDIENLIDYRDPQGRPETYTGATAKRYRDLAHQGDRLSTLSVVAFAATGVAAGAAVLFFVLDARAHHEAPAAVTGPAAAAHLAPTLTPSSVGLTWGGSF